MTEIRIPFKGWDLVTFINEKDGDDLVAVRPIAEAIGVVWSKQMSKIKKDPKFNWVLKYTVAQDGKKRELFCLPVRQLNGWLYGINANRVKEDIREKLIQFQEECHIAIYNHMSGSANVLVVEKLYAIVAELQKANALLVEELAVVKKQVQAQNEILGLEASIAGRRLSAARKFKIVRSK